MLLYRLLISLFAVHVLFRTAMRDGRGAALARLSLRAPPGQGQTVWLHAASNGELASVRPVLERLLVIRPDLDWLITANTDTGVDLVKEWSLPRVSGRLAPVDLRWTTRRLYREWNVCAHIAVEAELWPNRFLTCPGPVLLIGARMTSGTARGWRKLPRLARRILTQVVFASAQDERSAERLLTLGLPPVARWQVADLKAYYEAPQPKPAPELDAGFDRHNTWLAASTHDGEDTIVLEAHKLCVQVAPETQLILAPRHPRRAQEIIELASQQELTCGRRSQGDSPGATQVYIADTMGEMPQWYSRAGRVFIGGTLTDRGGHTPYEPAAFGAALLHGPDTRNFRSAFARLAKASASIEIRDARQLVAALLLLQAAADQDRAGRLAQDVLTPETDFETLVTALSSALPASSTMDGAA